MSVWRLASVLRWAARLHREAACLYHHAHAFAYQVAYGGDLLVVAVVPEVGSGWGSWLLWDYPADG